MPRVARRKFLPGLEVGDERANPFQNIHEAV
eukprot:CAMPEP_0117746850 /NCGR_PEP_ID=MMETSP0947-20121206/8177_1 /TAXON_ID=44440 /ORGANISM="Chattonella subsalsa, Strain CCMP2191" /LENGTH=30 /DNA_ID= /DNA_START= /DNA_END= /DNA_ORIENTATION=